MPATDLPLLIDAARIAGRVATSFAGPTAARWDKPGDAGPVTEADLAVNEVLSRTLQLARPNYGWLSEETEDSAARLSADTVFIIDPIDGTRSFVEGGRTWAISIGVAHRGVVTAAAIYLPLRDKLYAAGAGLGATLNGAPLVATQGGMTSDSKVLAARPTFDAKHWRGDAPAVERHYRPSLAYRLSLVGEGKFDGMLTLRPTWEWDIAAGSLIVSEAGGTITDRTGAPLRFNNAHPALNGVVAGGPGLHRALVGELGPDHAA
ncbi:3'(2'),5'-bisphosphate nucleotidase CysQ [Tateyamaria omphalii]|uniref:3'(2'),5'-bisphosphate nucleotidase CysQ n=1 Tax=Tateyamaria omphalii TaxID=299262 RepID=A0A1P8MY74_9RHOB|nr:3'(2'),5'-bisphosphate nucleotidase CysQ [Tateyamaria omphalii]APX12983.1 3'(2'),5'-bisphosphate nucleotidase CysQ [Tateyamaria omphalii]